MNMHLVDWSIITALVAFMVAMALYTKRYSRSTADFLAANRCGGRYLLATSEGAANMGAIYIMALFEMHYQTGFVSVWWRLIMMPAAVLIALSGWVIYRFRQTRVLTMAQFFEVRYSKRFRIFAGLLSWICGVINFGIFPAVGARFFIYFCGFPQEITMFGIIIPTIALIMLVLLGIALFFTFCGGQIAVMVTDFIQGIFCSVAGVILLGVLFYIFDWSQIIDAFKMAPAEASLVHPFKTKDVDNFNIFFFLIAVFGLYYNHLSWQGNQGYNCAAKSPHEARMGKILGSFREYAQMIPIVIIPIFAYTIMHNQDFHSNAESVSTVLSTIEGDYIQTQMTVPVAMSSILPIGAMGLMFGIIFASFISNCDTYLHSWGSIFIQDVILPFKKKPIGPQQHMKLLRLSIIGVALFVFLWSLLFKQTTEIFFYFAITGTIYLGGSGAVILGGLYWKRGTTAGAWAALILGSTLGVSGLLVCQYYPDFPINGQVLWFMAMIGSSVIYVIISLFGKKQFNMDQLLHRGNYAIEQDTVIAQCSRNLFMERLGISKEFTRQDKRVFFISVIWTFVWVAVFIFGVIYNLTKDVPSDSWVLFWKVWVVINVVYSVLVTIWLSIGGVIDIKKMFHLLSKIQRNDLDDGTVLGNRNLADIQTDGKIEETD